MYGVGLLGKRDRGSLLRYGCWQASGLCFLLYGEEEDLQ